MMNQSIINQRIRVALPPEFHQMDPEEKKRIYALSAVVPEWCARDSERHMIFSASWKQMNGLLAAMACSMDGAKGLEIDNFGFTGLRRSPGGSGQFPSRRSAR